MAKLKKLKKEALASLPALPELFLFAGQPLVTEGT